MMNLFTQFVKLIFLQATIFTSLILLLSVVPVKTVMAQDIHFSQFANVPLQLNPAMV